VGCFRFIERGKYRRVGSRSDARAKELRDEITRLNREAGRPERFGFADIGD
jgi:hypothetical protein